MAVEIKREEIAKITKQLNECKAKIKQGNVHLSCLFQVSSGKDPEYADAAV